MTELRLEVREFLDLTRWRWVLTDASGAFVADHEVRLNPADWQSEAFTDLPFYLHWHAAPDRRYEDEARIVDEVGQWIGSQVLGAVGPALLLRQPAAVRVAAPPEATALLLRPLELAHVDGKPISVQGVTLIMQSPPGGTPPRESGSLAASAGEQLRVLGLFSLPDGGRALNLRRERYSLVQLIEGIAATGKATQVRVLQYGVTRSAVRDALSDGEGWDIIHISGHGRPGELLLETADGAPDLVSGPDLADLLDTGQGRVKLVTVSACSSAAMAAQGRRLLGLPDGAQADDDPQADAGTGTDSGTVATLLAARLGCAVLAMRYPVGDEFATALTERLYELLVGEGQPLPHAVGMTLRELDSASSTGQELPALSVATPALFGDVAANLRLAAPGRLGPLDYDTGRLKMAGFPPQAPRFVGRTAVMARASAALAARSGVPGVLLHGMPGSGKTACALELGYGQEHAFDRLAWHKAPDDGTDISGALTDFAFTLERYLPGFQMADVLADRDTLAGFLPRLTELAERQRMLIVIDNAESLLTESGRWRDERWGLVVDALVSHAGLGRLVLTSRRVPAGLTALRAESVDALSADEALLLASELPHLRALMDGKAPPLNPGAARQLARRTLTVVQGHPKLLELADGQAASPAQLAQLVQKTEQAWRARGGLPAGFFTNGETTATATDYLHILASWTTEVAGTLTPAKRDLFWFLCCLEESDRQRAVLEPVWPRLWSHLGRDGQPPGLDQALAALAAQGLAAISAGTDSKDESFAVHPGVAATGRSQAGKAFQDAVDLWVAQFWWEVHLRTGESGLHTRLAVRAGLAAAPYLIRQRHWKDAGTILERAFLFDRSRSNAAAILPAIARVADHAPVEVGKLARVLWVIDPTTADARMRTHLAAVVARGDYRAASVATEQLIDWCRSGGRLAEALALAGQLADYTRQAGLGSWSQLSAEVRRLQVLIAMGQPGQVLADVRKLHDRMQVLPATPVPDQHAVPWDVRETLLNTGCHAALDLGQWGDALALNAEAVASMRDRRAPAAEIARARFNDYRPLLALGDTDGALALLLECRRAFEDARDVGSLAMTLGALSAIEAVRGHGDAAIRLGRDGLRYSYLVGDVGSIAVGYDQLGSYLHRLARQGAPALACYLTAALIEAITGAGGEDESLSAAATVMLEFGDDITLPTSVAGLCRQLGDIPGTDLPALLAEVSPDSATTNQALRDVITRAMALADPSLVAPAQSPANQSLAKRKRRHRPRRRLHTVSSEEPAARPTVTEPAVHVPAVPEEDESAGAAAARAADEEPDENIALLKRTLAEHEREFGDAHFGTVDSRSNLANAYLAARRLDDAIALYERNLAAFEQRLGSTHFNTLISYYNLANVYQMAGRSDDAVTLRERIVANHEQAFGDTHPDTMTARSYLAAAYRTAGKLDEAITVLRRNLSDRERVLGKNHPDTVTSRRDLAAARQAAERMRDPE